MKNKRNNRVIMRGVDFDIDNRQAPSVAYVVYFNGEYDVVQEATIHAETVYPLSLIDSIRMFRPDTSIGCNVTFTYPTNITTTTSVIYF